MKRVVIVPSADARQFAHFEVVAHDGALVALASDTVPERTRAAYETEDSFLGAVALGRADLYTFESLAQATAFAVAKLFALAQAAQEIEEAIRLRTIPKTRPQRQRDELIDGAPQEIG